LRAFAAVDDDAEKLLVGKARCEQIGTARAGALVADQALGAVDVTARRNRLSLTQHRVGQSIAARRLREEFASAAERKDAEEDRGAALERRQSRRSRREGHCGAFGSIFSITWVL